VRRLPDLTTSVNVERIIGDLVPPPQFAEASFATYLPDPQEPSQGAAKAALEVFAERINVGKAPRSRKLFRRGQPPESRPGVYLDGGFGVGKTHLLAALWHAVETDATSWGTFVEYTNVIGLLGFREAVRLFSTKALVCIDEFELDDPGDTVLMSTFLGELVDSGVYLAATSNTLPDRLGEERFASEDFTREIQGLAAHFDTIRIDGPDFRHRDLSFVTEPFSTKHIQVAVANRGDALDLVVTWAELLTFLSTVHPAHFGSVVEDISLLGLLDVTPVRDQVQALRVVTFVDRLYDRSVPVINSGVRLDQIFTADMLKGGYRKKYFRCLSRLAALADSGAKVVG